MLLTLACAFAACTQPFPTAPDDALLLAQGSGEITVAYYCGNTFQFRNRSLDTMTVQWRVHGVQESGALVLPARGGAEYSETYLTTLERGPLQVSRNGRVLKTVPNGHTAQCDVPVAFPEAVPDSVPSWVFADSNMVRDDSLVTGAYPRGILVVSFRPTSTTAERGALMQGVDAEVVGGIPGEELPRGRTTDRYYIRLRGDRSTAAMKAALTTLLASPIVRNAGFDFVVSPLYLRPIDGPGWRNWAVGGHPSTQENWALELLRGPLAWGCTVGSDSTLVGIIDQNFSNVTDLNRNLSSVLLPTWSSAPRPHGTFVASVAAARGDDSTGMTGVQWRAGLLLHDVPPNVNVARAIIEGYEKLSIAGARIVNLSWGIGWKDQFGRLPNPGLAQDRALRDDLAAYFEREVAAIQTQGFAPLVVISAGNDGIDAGWAGYPLSANSVFGDRVIVVGATDRGDGITTFSNRGPLVTTYAPGDNVYGLDETGFPTWGSGTSFAAPYVTGAAGLLFTLDPTLSPQDAKQLLVAGAIRRGVAVEGRYRLDLHEPLKIAAEKAGAPLCGNRLWAVGNQVYATRATGAELVGTVSDEVGQILPYHGGRKVLIQKGESARFAVFELRGGGVWDSTGLWDRLDSTGLAGSGFSAVGRMHDLDSLAFLSGSSVRIGTSFFGGNSRVVGTVPTGTVSANGETCVVQVKSGTTWNCTVTVFQSITSLHLPFQRVTPVGDSTLLWMEETTRTETAVQSAWLDCTSLQPAGEHSSCRFHHRTPTEIHLGSSVWSMRRSATGNGIATKVLDIPDNRIAITITAAEDGGSIAIATGATRIPGSRVSECQTQFYSYDVSGQLTPSGAPLGYGATCATYNWQGGFGATQELLTAAPAPTTERLALQARLMRRVSR